MCFLFRVRACNYSYITRDREWQQDDKFFWKGSLAHARFIQAIAPVKTSSSFEGDQKTLTGSICFLSFNDRRWVWLVAGANLFHSAYHHRHKTWRG